MKAAEVKSRLLHLASATTLQKAGGGTYAHTVERVKGRIPAPGTFMAWCNGAEVEHYLHDPAWTARLLDVVVDCPGTSRLFDSRARLTLRASGELVVASAVTMSRAGGSSSSGFHVALARLEDAIVLLVLTPGSMAELAHLLDRDPAQLEALPARQVSTAVPT